MGGSRGSESRRVAVERPTRMLGQERGELSLLVNKWANPEGGEEVEFTAEGEMIVRREGEVITSQRWSAQDSGTGAGRLVLSTAEGAEVSLGFCVSADILAMSYAGETTIYVRAA